MNVKYEQAVAREEQNRRLGYIGIARPVFGIPLVPLTLRHVIELSLAENAFMVGTPATPDDLYQFLWRIHRGFRRPDGNTPNVSSYEINRGMKSPGRFASFVAKWQIFRLSRTVNIVLAEKLVREWIAEFFQDEPAGRSDNSKFVSDLVPRMRWWDQILADQVASGHTIDNALDLTVAQAFQLMRSRLIEQGELIRCIPPSAKLKKSYN